ncbi:TetR/AcrR family transcriptional regulator [Corynebacterium sp. 335C]
MEPGQDTRRRRMSGPARRRQLMDVARSTFAERGFEGTAMEEIAARAGVSKPVVYEHFGTKDALYRAVADEETARLEAIIGESMEGARARLRIEKAVLALLTYVEEHADGFTILARDPVTAGGYATLLGLATGRVSHILGAAFDRAGLDPRDAELYSNALVGMVAQTAQWWLDERVAAADAGGPADEASVQRDREQVAAHIVNLCWNGLAGMEREPRLRGVAAERLPDEGVRLGAGSAADPADDARVGR